MSGVVVGETSEIPDIQSLSGEEKSQAMADWFFENFEDPANHLPYDSREGGYQWIWGGPYDAREEVSDAFHHQATQEELDEAADIVESDGTADWTVNQQRLVEEPDDDEIDFDQLRSEVMELRAQLNALRDAPPGMGHNNPPDAIADEQPTADELSEGIAACDEVVAEIDRDNASDPTTFKRASEVLFRLAKRFSKWAGSAILAGTAAFTIGYISEAGSHAYTNPAEFVENIEHLAVKIGRVIN